MARRNGEGVCVAWCTAGDTAARCTLSAILMPHMLVPAMPGPMPPALPTTERRGLSISRGSRQRANSARYSLLIWGERQGRARLGRRGQSREPALPAGWCGRVARLYLAGLGWAQAMRQLDDPLQPLHQLLEGSSEER